MEGDNKNLKQRIVEVLRTAKKLFDIKWDRYTFLNGQYAIYGWIYKKDGVRDFIIVFVNENEIGFSTSSAKYSKALHQFFGSDIEHVNCIKVEELYQDASKLEIVE